MPTNDRDTRIKTHYAAANHPELVKRLLASELPVDLCMRELAMADATPSGTPVASTTNQATEAEALAKGILDSYHGTATTNQATEAESIAAGIIDSYRAYINLETQSETLNFS